jgi:glycosyltransferase involved in cell wall biosynthesis
VSGNEPSFRETRKVPTLSVIIPTLDEQEGIGKVLADIQKSLTIPSTAIVVDGHSTDKTVEVAIRENAEIVFQQGIGYGNALQTGFRYALENYDSQILIMMDADGTYDAKDLDRLVMPILRGEADFVIGNRLDSMDYGAMSFVNRIGNIIISNFVSILIQHTLTDTQCGLRAFRRSLAHDFVTGPRGMPFAAEMVIRAARKKARMVEIPVRYHSRLGTTKLNPWKDGMRILLSIVNSFLPHNQRRRSFDRGTESI